MRGVQECGPSTEAGGETSLPETAAPMPMDQPPPALGLDIGVVRQSS